jgi:hypothetical protein
MEDTILRKYPTLKDEGLFKYRYTKENFEKYTQIQNSIENYEKWKIGINYKTNRKIKIGGKTHFQIGYDFYIKHKNSLFNYSYILFTELDGINIELYLQETEKLKNEILSYNEKVNEIICKIKKLEKWVDFVEFEGKKYGIPKIYDYIHRENDCNGKTNETKVRIKECRECSGTTSFQEPCECKYITIIKCVKCGYSSSY